MRQPQGQISRCNWTSVVRCSESKLGVAGLALWSAARPLSWRQTRNKNNTHTHTCCCSLDVNKLAADAKKSLYRWWRWINLHWLCSGSHQSMGVFLTGGCFFLSMKKCFDCNNIVAATNINSAAMICQRGCGRAGDNDPHCKPPNDLAITIIAVELIILQYFVYNWCPYYCWLLLLH